MLKVLNIGRKKERGAGRTPAGGPTFAEARRDRQAAVIARNRPFIG